MDQYEPLPPDVILTFNKRSRANQINYLFSIHSFPTISNYSFIHSSIHFHSFIHLYRSGMSKAQWAKVKAAEKNKNKGKNLGKVGITSFESRTFAQWQRAGGKNLFPVDPNSVKNAKEIPYMQRQGGKPDDSDLKKGGGFLSGIFGKKKAPEPPKEPEPVKKKNPWTF